MSLNLDSLLKLAQGKKAELAAKSTFSNIVKLPKARSRWRILPGWNPKAPEVFFHDFGQHYIKDRDGQVLVVYVCEYDTFGRECGICDRVNEAIRQTKDDSILKLLKEMKSRQIQLVNAVRVDGAEANPKKPVLLGLPSSVMTAYLSTLAEYQTEHNIVILDPNEGHNVTIERAGDGLNTKYSLMCDPKPSKVDPEALNNLIDISAFVEGEYQKGVRKGTALLESNTRALLANAGSGTTLIPARAERIVPSRTIEADETEVPWAQPETAKPDSVEVNAATVATPALKAGAATDEALDDEELQKILQELD